MKSWRLVILSFFLFTLTSNVSWAGPRRTVTIENEATDFNSYFDGTPGCFILHSLKHGEILRFNDEACKVRHAPCSTFQVPNTLVALETNTVESPDQVLPWDGSTQPNKRWEKDQSLVSALKDSVAWVYTKVSKDVGVKAMRNYLKDLDYGNHKMSRRTSQFWLDGSLQISAEEQVKFLTKLYSDNLPVSQRSMQVTRDALTLEEKMFSSLSGKEASCTQGDDKVGWFVGYVKSRDQGYVFATALSGDEHATGENARLITHKILSDMLLF